MRRDVGFYIEAPVEQVYQAYLNAATHKPFVRYAAIVCRRVSMYITKKAIAVAIAFFLLVFTVQQPTVLPR